MSDRELRDEIERLSAELRRHQREPGGIDAETSAKREALRVETAELRTQVSRLKESLTAVKSQQHAHEAALLKLRARLASTRAEIAERDPLNEPSARVSDGWSDSTVITEKWGCSALLISGLVPFAAWLASVWRA